MGSIGWAPWHGRNLVHSLKCPRDGRVGPVNEGTYLYTTWPDGADVRACTAAPGFARLFLDTNRSHDLSHATLMTDFRFTWATRGQQHLIIFSRLRVCFSPVLVSSPRCGSYPTDCPRIRMVPGLSQASERPSLKKLRAWRSRRWSRKSV